MQTTETIATLDAAIERIDTETAAYREINDDLRAISAGLARAEERANRRLSHIERANLAAPVLLRSAAKRLTDEFWTQGWAGFATTKARRDDSDSHIVTCPCLVCVVRAVTEEFTDAQHPPRSPAVFPVYACFQALAAVLPLRDGWASLGDLLAEWSYAPERSAAEVRDALRRAAVQAEGD